MFYLCQAKHQIECVEVTSASLICYVVSVIVSVNGVQLNLILRNSITEKHVWGMNLKFEFKVINTCTIL